MFNYHLFCRAFTLFKLTLLFVLVLNAECAQNDDEVKVTLKVLRPYKANLTYVIQGYVYEHDNIVSPVLSTESEPDVKWYFQLFSKMIINNYFAIKLCVRSLPSNAARFSGLVECGQVENDGQKIYFGKSSKSIGPEGYFEQYTSENVRDGDLTIYCDVKGFLYHHEIAKKRKNRESVNSTHCANEIANDTIEKLSLYFDKRRDIELESSRKRFRCQSNILKDRLPLFNLTASNVDQNQTIVYDMNEHVNAKELEDLVNFMHRGKSANLNRTCRVLYGVASKFGFQCLRVTCEDILISQVKGTNANEYLELAELVKSERLKERAVHCITKPEEVECLA